MNKGITCSGALFYSMSSKRFLLLHRANGKRNNLWGLVGGTNEGKETPWEALKREIFEEIGEVEDIKKVVPLETFISNDSLFVFHTYLCLIEKEFIPSLNSEHDGYAWVTLGKWPKPLHNGLANSLKNKTNQQKLQTLIELLEVINL